MKLYRATPDQLGCLSGVKGYCEDVFYKLGYINVSSVLAFFLNDDFAFDSNPLYKRPEGKFFYVSPWDAAVCSEDMHGGFNLSRVLEYDFPDEIIDESIRGFGVYSGRHVPEAKIPYEILEREGVIETPLSQELETKLRETKLEILRDSLELYKTIEKWPEKFIEIIERVLNNPDEYATLHELNIKALRRLIKCSYITGRMFPITRQNRIDRDNQSEEVFMNASNGVLTKENYEEWKQMREKIYKISSRRYSMNDVDWKKVLK